MNCRFPPLLLSVVMSALLGCQAPTQITLDLSTDAPCSEDGARAPFNSAAIFALDAASVQGKAALDAPNAITGRCVADLPVNEIGTLALVPSGSDDESFGLRIHVGVGEQSGESCAALDCGDDQCIDIRRRVSFVPQQSLRLPVVASQNCLGVCCPNPDETCVDGACVGLDVAGCDPDQEDCTPPAPSPSAEGLVPIWQTHFALNGATVSVRSVTLDVGAAGPTVAIGGTYRTNGNNQIVIDAVPLPASPTTDAVFVATFTPFGPSSLTSLTHCAGADVELRDLAVNDDRVVALLQSGMQGMVVCARADLGSSGSTPVEGAGAPVVFSSSLGPTTSLGLTKLLQSPNGTTDATGIVALSSRTVVAATFRGGIPPLLAAGDAVAQGSPGLWTWVDPEGGAPITGPFLATSLPLFHGITQDRTTGTVWRLGLLQRAEQQVLVATSNESLLGSQEAAGTITRLSSPRRIAGTPDVVVPIEFSTIDLDPNLAPGVAALRFNGPTSAAPLEVALAVEDGAEPFAGGTARGVCLGYRRNDEHHIQCEHSPTLSIAPASLEGLDMDTLTVDDRMLDAALVVGQYAGPVPSLGLDPNDDAQRLYLALLERR